MDFEYSFVIAVDFLGIVGIVSNIQGHFDLVKTVLKALDRSTHLSINSALVCQSCHILHLFSQSTSMTVQDYLLLKRG